MKPQHDRVELLAKINRFAPKIMDAQAEGKYQSVYEYRLEQHQLVIQLFGSTAGPAGSSYVHLAEALYHLGRVAEARGEIDKALSIYKRLDRTDTMRDHLENLLVRILTRQGHLQEVEQLHHDRISRMYEEGTTRDRARAVMQGELAKLYIRQGSLDQALKLLQDSLRVFEQTDGLEARETGICCLIISHVFKGQEKYDDAEHYGRRALQCVRSSGDDQAMIAIVSDDLAVTVAFLAERQGDTAKAREAVMLSDESLQYFRQVEPNGREAARSAYNNSRLKDMLRSLAPSIPSSSAAETSETAMAFPTLLFISHAYEDAQHVDLLMKNLPDYVEPVVSEPVEVPPTALVSERIVKGVLGTDGLISINSPKSNESYWTSFERDIASRAKKPMFLFDPETLKISRYQSGLPNLRIAHLYHPHDSDDVSKVMRWLVDERSFGAFDDEKILKDYSSPPFSSLDPMDRDLRLMSVRSFGTVYLIFISQHLLDDDGLVSHMVQQAADQSRTTMFCWLDDVPTGNRNPATVEQLKAIPIDSIRFKLRPTHPSFDMRQLDDLMIRLVWMIYRSASGGWPLGDLPTGISNDT